MNNFTPRYLSQLIAISTMGKAPARFTYSEQGGSITLLSEGRYLFLFVLQGSVEVQTSLRMEVFSDRTLAVIDKLKIGECICLPGTVLLEFLPPKRIEYFFSSASKAFGTACSEHIPFIAEIDSWIEQLYTDCLHGLRPDEYTYCCQLRRLLRNYPDIVLGTLVIPLHACALTSGKCAQCKTKSAQVEALLASSPEEL